MSVAEKADQNTIRRHNASLVLNQLRLNAPLSRADLAKRIGLNRSTVSSIVAQLLEEKLIVETEFRSDRIGRPGLLLELNAQGGGAIGVEIGPGFVHVIFTDFVANVLWRRRIRIGDGEVQDTYIHIAEEMIRQALSAAEDLDLRAFGVGLALPGMVDARQGELCFAPNLRWRDVAFGSRWSERYSLPVSVENNANAGAIGEYYFGAARDVADFVYLGGDAGIGGGIVVNGQLLRGLGGFAGEIGHMTIVPDGKLCSCGKRGCWETVVGPHAVIADYQQRASALNTSARLDVDNIGFAELAAAAAMHDLAAGAALHEAAKYLGIGIANLVNIFNPQLVVLGGVLGQVSESLMPGIREAVKKESLFPMRAALSIVPSRNGADDCVMGAVALVLDNVLREPV
jgi:predicted NBD/HSP70 family sugar kinase/DNA-binding XRE family transcriptional regulator